MTSINYGNKVTIIFTKDSNYKENITLRNVTEIHYNYSSHENRVAFESDIHYAGATYNVKHIKEFETRLETSKAKTFYHKE